MFNDKIINDMTIRELYEYALIEMNKVEAPSLLLEDYNYFINKAVQQYINKVYNRYDINQQSSDDLRVLKATAQLDVKKEVTGRVANKQKFVYVAELPNNYMHILNCIIEYEVQHNFKCYNEGDYIDFPARRLTADMAAGIMHNVYMKPDYKRPYFYINNVNKIEDENAIASRSPRRDPEEIQGKLDEDADVSPIEYGMTGHQERTDSVKEEDTRLANTSKVRLEVRFGDDDTIFTPKTIYIDYIKAPMFIRLTYQDITDTEDHTRILEFPDYACFEIVNEFVKLLMENASDPRLQTNYAVNQTIADPTAPQPQSQSSRDKS